MDKKAESRSVPSASFPWGVVTLDIRETLTPLSKITWYRTRGIARTCATESGQPAGHLAIARWCGS